MARQKDQTSRRGHLIQATLETIAARGLAGVSLKNIADVAGISPRLVAYYYPDIDALVEAAHQTATERYYWSRQATLDESDPCTRLARLMHSGLPRNDDRLLSQVLDEMSVNAARSPMHATLMTLLFDREVSLYVAVLEAGRASGDFDLAEPPDVIARNFVLLEDALGLHLLGNNTSVDLASAERQLASYARCSTGADIVPVSQQTTG